MTIAGRLCATTALSLSLILAQGLLAPVHAADIVVDTDSGRILVNGADSGGILGGTPFTVQRDGNVVNFLFAGDLNFGATDVVKGIGASAAQIIVGNNLSVAQGARIDFSAVGSRAGAGGGTGGDGGGGGAGGTGAGTGGAGGGGGGGGRGGTSQNNDSQWGFAGGQGGTGAGGNMGATGSTGQMGSSGGIGVNSTASVAQGGAGGAGGSAGTGGGGGDGGIAGGVAPAGSGVSCGFLGICSGTVDPGQGGRPGSVGGAGANGGTGTQGTAGQRGTSAVSGGDGSLLVGGNGGAGAGGSGGGGQGGGGGGSGGGGGGGGAGTSGYNDGNEIYAGGNGGNGGTGSVGATGGNGGSGGAGGAGGGGGGAVGFIVRGIATVDGQVLATGANGVAGGNGGAAGGTNFGTANGGAGGAGLKGENRDVSPFGVVASGGLGGAGGQAGQNGSWGEAGHGGHNSFWAGAGGGGGGGGGGGYGGGGGAGGAGTQGATGGDGSGGTVAIIGSVTRIGGATINTLGGQADGLSPVNNGGRVVIGSNTQSAGPTITGQTLENLSVFTNTVTIKPRLVICPPFGGGCTPDTVIGTFSAATQAAADAQAAQAVASFLSTPLIGIFYDTTSITTAKTVASAGQGYLVNGQNHVVVNGTADARSTVTTLQGPTTVNPFIKDAQTGGSFLTPYIPNLKGGAEGFGVLDGVKSTDAFFDAVRAQAKATDEVALMRVDLGPAGYDFDFEGFDAILLINLTSEDLLDPMLGIVENGSDPTFLLRLLAGGFANDELFGGEGPIELALLEAYGVYMTLVPDWGTSFNFGFEGKVVSDVELALNRFVFFDTTGGEMPDTDPVAVAEPRSLAVLATGLGGLFVFVRRRRRERSPLVA
jgi:hypothetical protein